METINIFGRQHGGEHHRFANLFGQRCLDENAVQARLAIQAANEFEQVRLGRLAIQNVSFRDDAEFGTGLFFPAHVDFGSGVFTHADKGKAGHHAARFQGSDAGDEFLLDLRRNRAPVNQIGYHRWNFLTFSGALVEST